MLQRHHAAVRNALVARRALRAFAASAALVAVAVLLGAGGGGSGASSARLVLLGAGITTAIALAVRTLLREVPHFDAWLESVEQSRPEVRSWLRNALDLESGVAPGTSQELATALCEEAQARLSRTDLNALKSQLNPTWPLTAVGAATVAVAVFCMVSPQVAMRSWRTLWNPALAAPPISLIVEPGSVMLSPGATLAVRATVRGSTAAPRLLGTGAAPAPALESEANGARHWRFDLPPVTRARDYAVRVQREQSPRYRISLAGEPLPVSFLFEYHAPAYAQLPVQTGAATRGDVAALRGSRARIEVTFDRDLEALTAARTGERAIAWKAITPRRWHGEVRVDGDGEWTLAAAGSSGKAAYRYRISALADAPPVLTVAAPRADLDLPAGSMVPYDVLVQDDLGISDVRLQWRKESAEPWRDVPLASPATHPREARVTSRWDASSLALLPGESGTFRFEARDNNAVSGASRATSPEFRVRFPSLTDMYANLDRKQETVAQSLQKVAENARELQKSLDQLQRQTPRQQQSDAPRFERAEEMRKALERQREMSRQVDEAAQQMQQHMAESSEREAYRAELQQKMREMNELMQQIQSPEFREALERMQKAIEKLDRQNMEQQLPQMQQANRDMLKNLERALALLKQLRDEERLDALSKRAEDLAKRQDELNQEHQKQASTPNSPAADRKELADRQQKAAEQTEQLAKDASDAAQSQSQPQAQQDLQKAAETLEQEAAPQQSQASSQSQSGQSQKAKQSGQKASQSLRDAASRMNASSQQAQAQRDGEQIAAMRRAAQDLVTLGREAAQNLQRSAAPQDQANRQTDLSEGIARVADSLAALGRETPALSPEVQEMLGRAMNQMSSSGRQMSQGNRAGGEQAGQAAGSALTEAINALRDSEASMCNKPGSKPGEGQGGQNGKKMGKLSQQQSELNARSKELTQRMTQQMRLSAGDQAEVRRLADEQARLRQELESIQQDDAAKRELLGRLDQTQRDMQAAEEQLRAGQLGDELEERQARILSRMLDAQRSLHRREFDPQREAQRGEDVARTSPAPLSESLLRENDRVRLGLLKADADRYPAQYRALIERYLQRLNGSPK